MNGDIQKFIQCCEKCQTTNPPFKKSNAALHPVPVHSQVWHTVSGNIMIIHNSICYLVVPYTGWCGPYRPTSHNP